MFYFTAQETDIQLSNEAYLGRTPCQPVSAAAGLRKTGTSILFDDSPKKAIH